MNNMTLRSIKLIISSAPCCSRRRGWRCCGIRAGAVRRASRRPRTRCRCPDRIPSRISSTDTPASCSTASNFVSLRFLLHHLLLPHSLFSVHVHLFVHTKNYYYQSDHFIALLGIICCY